MDSGTRNPLQLPVLLLGINKSWDLGWSVWPFDFLLQWKCNRNATKLYVHMVLWGKRHKGWEGIKQEQCISDLKRRVWDYGERGSYYKEDDRIHRYMLPSDDCFAHLEVQFRFLACRQRWKVCLDGLISPILWTLQSPVWLCQLWEAKISIGLLHFSLQIASFAFSFLEVIMRTERGHWQLNRMSHGTAPEVSPPALAMA